MKKTSVLIVVAIMCVSLVACGKRTSQKIVSRELGVDVSGGTEISYEDTHGGFHGDGTTSIVLQFNDNSMLDAIKKDPKWKEFPLDEIMHEIVCGSDMEIDGHPVPGPLIQVPKIQNGYYILIDRHSEKDKNILERYSFNFTVGLYDTDANILYFCELDT